jgi:hypothetical protein
MVKLDPISVPQIDAPDPAPARAARSMAERTSPVRVPTAQIDRMAVRTELPDALPPIAEHRAVASQSARTVRATPGPAAIDRVAVPGPKWRPHRLRRDPRWLRPRRARRARHWSPRTARSSPGPRCAGLRSPTCSRA